MLVIFTHENPNPLSSSMFSFLMITFGLPTLPLSLVTVGLNLQQTECRLWASYNLEKLSRRTSSTATWSFQDFTSFSFSCSWSDISSKITTVLSKRLMWIKFALWYSSWFCDFVKKTWQLLTANNSPIHLDPFHWCSFFLEKVFTILDGEHILLSCPLWPRTSATPLNNWNST